MTFNRTRNWKHAWLRCETTGEVAPRFRCRCMLCGAARSGIERERREKKAAKAARRSTTSRSRVSDKEIR